MTSCRVFVRWIFPFIVAGCSAGSPSDSIRIYHLASGTTGDNRTPKQGINLRVLEESSDRIILEYSLSQFQVKKLSIEGSDYAEISVANASTLREKGLPSLPFLFNNLMIAESGSYDFKIESIESQRFDLGVPVASKGDLDRSQSPELVEYPFSDFYHSKESFPTSSFKMGNPFILRDTRGIRTEFFPFVYDAESKQTEVISHLRVSIFRKKNDAGLNVISRPTALTQDFAGVYSSYFANAETAIKQHEFANGFPAPYQPGGILIVTADLFKDAMAPFIQWKIERGLPTKMVTLSQIGAKPTATDIYNVIKAEYQASHFSHVLLVGDAEFLPPRKGTAGNVVNRPADPTYGNLAGDDDYPDAIVSRFSAKTPRDVSIMVQRTLQYERTPETSVNWYSKHLGVASNESYSDGKPKDWQRMRVVQDILKTGDYTTFREVFDPSADAKTIEQTLQEGLGFINYIGHGILDAWVTSGFSNRNISRLTNSRWPFIISVACYNGAFGSEMGDAFAEAWTKAGTPEMPTGALAVNASSTSQSWVPPTTGQKRAAEFLAKHVRTSAGEIFFSASIGALDEGSSTAVQTFQSWHVFGDGTAQIHTKIPVKLTPVMRSEPVRGKQKISLSGLPAHALVAFTAGQSILAAAYGSDDGFIELDLDIPAAINIVRMTISGFNMIPLQRDFSL